MITLVINADSKVDYFFLDVITHGISIPESQIFPAIFASLRMKHDVLILTSGDIPQVDFKKRFSTGEHFIHLSPRFLRFLIENYSRQTLNFPEFKAFLTASK